MNTVELAGVSRWYGNVVAVNDVTLSIAPGLTGLLGPNGAGKTTVLHLMAGLLAPSRGEVVIGGEPAWANPAVYRKLGLVTERESVPGFLTAWEFVLASAELHKLPDPEAAARAALDTVDLRDAQDRRISTYSKGMRQRSRVAAALDPVDLRDAQDRRISTYSKGMRQRSRVAAALVHDPDVLLLDEPFNGMDPRQRMHMMELLDGMAAAGRTIVFSSHILEEVEQLSGTVQVIVAGRLAASGDYRHIRRLMTTRPHVFTIASSDDRLLATALMAEPSVSGVSLAEAGLQVHTSDYGTFTRALAKIAKARGIRLTGILPSDESLEKVFSYLVTT